MPDRGTLDVVKKARGRKAALKSVAEELVNHGTLFQEDVVAILRRKASRRTMRKEAGREEGMGTNI